MTQIDYQTPSAAKPSKGMLVAGWVLSLLPVPLLCMSAFMKLTKAPQAMEGFVKYHYPERVVLPLGIVELTCTLLFLIPRTSVLGAILLTGYLGGATATHVAASEPFFIPVGLGVLLWLGLLLRNRNLRPLLPLTR